MMDLITPRQCAVIRWELHTPTMTPPQCKGMRALPSQHYVNCTEWKRAHNPSIRNRPSCLHRYRRRLFELRIADEVRRVKSRQYALINLLNFRDEVTGEWRKLHNTELHALYSSPDIIRNIKSRRLRWAGHVAHMGESRNAYRVLVGRPERKIPLGRPRRRWEDNIKMDLREVGYDDRDWINLAQDRDQWRAYVRAAMNLRVP
ncbi:hypothetical protein ANN_16783 [Periplaneta americana]|uniref:Endonuclease-reverse transcriptase n=1 Tax=Periplaneta americana TaxID=6978 RepID=A0ABQ8SSH9_PERAM|nr:hypothetical protein ANN_16783 [Periplaneta americana]